MLLYDAIEKYKQYLITMDKSSETVKGYTSDLTAFQAFIEEKYNCPLYLDELQTADIEDYLYSLKVIKKLQPASRSRNLYTLRSFWKYCTKKGFCKQNIAILLEPIKTQKKERVYLSMDEATELINSVEHPIVKVVIETLFYTGMRINECLKLKLKDVDLDRKIIHVINGKGKKDRNIPINKNLYTILKDYINNIRPNVVSTYFFATKKSGHISSTYVNRILQDTAVSLNWSKKITAHILRHSFASNLIRNGVNIVHVQKLLGHSNLNVTSIYTHANMEDLNQSINLL